MVYPSLWESKRGSHIFVEHIYCAKDRRSTLGSTFGFLCLHPVSLSLFGPFSFDYNTLLFLLHKILHFEGFLADISCELLCHFPPNSKTIAGDSWEFISWFSCEFHLMLSINYILHSFPFICRVRVSLQYFKRPSQNQISSLGEFLVNFVVALDF